MSIEVFFRIKNNDSIPFIYDQNSIVYNCDGNEGSLFFDGYYYVEDHPPPYPEDDVLKPWERPQRHPEWLPKNLEMFVKHDKWEKKLYIEVYKREIHESTDRISEEEDMDGHPMSVCFFPTNKQTIYFRVL
jgi:hypothetical protein